MTPNEAKGKCPHMNGVQQKLESHAEWQKIVKRPEDLSDPSAIARVQNLWHKKGYNGCIFSQVIAQDSDQFAWKTNVIDELNSQSSQHIDDIVFSAIEEPTTRLASLIFPSVTTEEDLRHLVQLLTRETKSIFLLKNESVSNLVALSLRVGINDNQVLAWIMGFGPFDYFAETRRAPYTEVVIPVKTKPDNTYHRHNQDKHSAHVADQHIDLDEKVLDRLWVNTHKKTRKVLGHEPNVFSGARTTFTIPLEMWKSIRS